MYRGTHHIIQRAFAYHRHKSRPTNFKLSFISEFFIKRTSRNLRKVIGQRRNHKHLIISLPGQLSTANLQYWLKITHPVPQHAHFCGRLKTFELIARNNLLNSQISRCISITFNPLELRKWITNGTLQSMRLSMFGAILNAC